ncbi:hypothetical protein ACF3DV_12945 [Chlorogloeopsis fritschii PCC 9212]|uniref:hypothetical protein n=1 Tax=Chlorogloeopsis fritschii TaxID=1124 RepID=UPI000F8CD970|nr:hypothetical protein [Chlorogloeopsis fritschii]MBF2008430.1 hypothetical protein [Chlorogloeopsis fritschii C42_A2020_084]
MSQPDGGLDGAGKRCTLCLDFPKNHLEFRRYQNMVRVKFDAMTEICSVQALQRLNEDLDYSHTNRRVNNAHLTENCCNYNHR